MRDNRGPWYILTGLIIGAVIGLLYAWAVQPVQYTNTTPASLRSNFKDQYRSLIALAYVSNGDMVRAKARLELLKDEDTYKALAEQAQRTLAEGGFPQEARALGLLAASLGQASPEETESSSSPGTPVTPSLTLNPTANTTPTTAGANPPLTGTTTFSTGTPQLTRTLGYTFTPLPTRTPTSTPGAPFILESRDMVCDPNLEEALIQIMALDAADQPVPGVEIAVNWEGSENRFFTGLIPELGLGYADFSMTPGTTYSLRLAEGGQPVTDLSPPECENNRGDRYYGTWALLFVQP